MYLVTVKGFNQFCDWTIEDLAFEFAFCIDDISQLAENIENILTNGTGIGGGIPDPDSVLISEIHVTEIDE